MQFPFAACTLIEAMIFLLHALWLSGSIAAGQTVAVADTARARVVEITLTCQVTYSQCLVAVRTFID